MAQGTSLPEFFKTAQDEIVVLFQKAIQESNRTIEQIAENSKQEMEKLYKGGAAKNIEKDLATIHDNMMNEITRLQKETEKSIHVIWENAKDKIVILGETLGDPQKTKQQIEDISKFVSNKIAEFIKTINKHCGEIIKAQEKFLEEMKKRVKK